MIEIRLHEVSDGDRPMLRGLAKLFGELANAALTGKVVLVPTPSQPVTAIDPDDAPDVGAPTAAEVFGGVQLHEDDGALNPDPSAVFGGTHFTGHGMLDPATTVGRVPPPPANLGNVPAAPLPTAPAPVNAAAPVPSIPPAPVPSGSTVELDIHGLPWDARIHASSRARNVDNSWRTKRNCDQALVASVTAELRTVMGIPLGNVPASFPIPASPVPAASPIVQAATHAVPPVSLGNVPLPPAPPVAPPSAPATASPPTVLIAQEPTGLTFAQLVPQITSRFNDGRLTQEVVTAVLGQVGLPSLPSLAVRKDLVPTVAAMLGIA